MAGDMQNDSDEKLAAVLNKIEMMILYFHQSSSMTW
jgi:hypothetical protein